MCLPARGIKSQLIDISLFSDEPIGVIWKHCDTGEVFDLSNQLKYLHLRRNDWSQSKNYESMIWKQSCKIKSYSHEDERAINKSEKRIKLIIS